MTFRNISHGWQGKQTASFGNLRRDRKAKSPTVIRQDLYAYYDFGDGKSYTGSGTSVTDLSGNGYTTTLTNTPTYSPVYGGVETFNSTNTRGTATVPDVSRTALTYISFIKRNGNTPTYAGINLHRTSFVSGNCAGLIFRDVSNQISYLFGSSSLNYDFVSNLTPPLGQWCMIAVAIDLTGGTLYLNNQSIDNTNTNTAVSPGTNLLTGNEATWNGGGNKGCNSDIGVSLVYTRKLTTSEIMHTFEVFRTRYGI